MLLGGVLVFLPGAILFVALSRAQRPIPIRESGPSASARLSAAHELISLSEKVEPLEASAQKSPLELNCEAEPRLTLRCQLVASTTSLPISSARGNFVIRGEKTLTTQAMTSDEAGWVELKDLKPGLCSVQTRVEGYVTQQRAVQIDASDKKDLIFRLEKSEELAVDVVDSAGAAVSGVEVRAWLRSASGLDNARAKTFDDGTFRLEGLRAGTWTVTAAAEGFRRATQIADVPADHQLHFELQQDPGFGVHVTDESGAPLEGVPVAVRSPTHGVRTSARSSRTDALGNARLKGVPEQAADKVAIEAKKKGFLEWNRSVSADELEARPLSIVLSRGLEVAGKVVDEAGESVSGAEVVLSSEAKAERISIKTTSAGEILLRNIAPGRYKISARTTTKGSSEPTALDLRDGDSPKAVVLTIKAGPGAIAGRVIDPDGRPVILAPVKLRASSGHTGEPLRTVTDEQGRFRFAGLKLEGLGTTCSITAGGGKTSRSSRDVTIGDEAIELVTPRLASVTGFVTGDAAPSAFEIHLEAEESEAEPVRIFRFSSNTGWFKLKGIEPGRYRLTAFDRGAALTAVAGIEARAGEDVGPIEVVVP